MHFEAIWACFLEEGNIGKCGFIGIMIIPGSWLAGVGLELLALFCNSVCKDRFDEPTVSELQVFSYSPSV